MTKAVLIDQIASRANVSRKEATRMLEAFTDIVYKEAFKEGKKVFLPGLGTFRNKNTSARIGRNPNNGEVINIAAKKRLSFTPSPSLIEKV